MENYLLSGGKSVLASLYNDKNRAEEAYFNLKVHGYSASEINVLMSKETQVQYYSDKVNKKDFRKIYSHKDLTHSGIADDFSSFGTNLKIPWPGLVVSGPLEKDFNIQDENGSSTVLQAVSKAGIPKDEMVRFIEGLKNGKILITVFSHNQNQLNKKRENSILEKTFY